METSVLTQAIRGAGGGGSSSSSSTTRTPITAADTVASKAKLALLDLLCEGQVKGLVGGAAGIILDGTQLENSDGTLNYQGFSWTFRDGRQDQTIIDGFPDVSTPYNLGTRIRQTAPVTFNVSNNDADAVRVIITIPQLSSQDTSTGDVTGTTVQYQFQMSYNNGPFMPVYLAGTDNPTITITDKSKAKYQREHLISLPKPGSNYKIRCLRLTADSDSSYLANETYLDSYYEIINIKMTYPNSVMVGINVDAEQFSSLPSRAYLLDGLYIRIPTNYNPETRLYTGIWDGTFKIGFSNNPAWILYDLLLNKRYGLGGFVKESNVNKAKLYQIGRYCDGLVTDGKGGWEPRFTLNTCIAAQADAYKIISDICSTFRGMSYWSGGMVQLTQDSPADAQFLFTNGNVVDGLFNRVGTARKDRHSVVHVTWNDPEDQYKQKIEYVEDADLIEEIGYRRSDTIAFGCTSRAQAHRVGLWILYTEKMETGLVTFTVGLEAMQVMPGDIVKIMDQWRSGKRNGGRLMESSRTGCKLDKVTQIAPNSIIAVAMPNGKFEEVTISNSGNTDTLTFATQLSEKPNPNAVWIITELSLVPTLARVVGIAQGEKLGEFVVSCVEHNPSKYAAIEQGLKLESYPTTILDPTFSTPENLQVDEVTYLAAPGILGTRLDVSWEGKSPTYYISWRRKLGDSVTGWTQSTVKVNRFELPVDPDGATYDFSVVSQSVTGKLSEPLVGSYTVLGSLNPPKQPTNLTALGDFRQIILNWSTPSSLDLSHFEVYENTVDNNELATLVGTPTTTSFNRGGLPGLATRYYWVKAVNRRGMKSQFNSNIGTSATTVQATHEDVVEQFVNESLLVPTLLAGLKGNEAQFNALQSYFDAAAELQSTVDQFQARIAELEEFQQNFSDGTISYVTQEQLLTAKQESTQAAVDQLNGVYAGPEGAIATAITNLKTSVDDKFSELQITAQTIDGLKSQYTVKIDNNGYVAGFGLASDSSQGVPTSEFLVLADRFAIAQPNAADGASYPFIVTTVNGQSRISMNSAFINEIVAAILKSPDNKFRIDLQNKLISIEV